MKIRNTYKDGYITYSDLATQSVPISYTAPNPLKISNDGLGAQTLKTYKPTSLSELYNVATGQFRFNDLRLGDEVMLRFNLNVTTSTANQHFRMYLNVAIGGNSYTINDGVFAFKTAGVQYIGFNITLSMSNLDTINYPAELLFVSEDNATIVVNSYYITIKKRF